MSTLLLRLVDQGKVKLDDRVSKYLPTIPDGNRVTLRMLAGMSSGYHDYEQDPALLTQLYSNPFGPITTRRQLELAFSRPLQFPPGTNWSYAHTNYVILGLVLEKVTRQPLRVALRRLVLRPLGLRETTASQTAAIPRPVLHAYTHERRAFLGIPDSKPFIEDSTYWNPSWTLARGAVQTTDIRDMTRTAIGIGSGRLLSRASFRQQMSPRLGFGRPQEGCEACRTLNRVYGYGLGVVRHGSWALQNPLFGGYGGLEAYLPSKRISIAVVATVSERTFGSEESPTNMATPLFSGIGAILAPGDAPPAAP